MLDIEMPPASPRSIQPAVKRGLEGLGLMAVGSLGRNGLCAVVWLRAQLSGCAQHQANNG